MAVIGGAVRRSGRRGLWIVAGIAAAGVVAAVVGIWHLPDRMYTDQAARAALQGGLLTAAAALTAVAGALIALDETRRSNANTHVRELYVAAIGQLGADSIHIRLGGIYALERIARDSAADQRTVVEVLSAFIRENTQPPDPAPPGRRPPPGRRWQHPPTPTDGPARRRPATDVQAALTILGRLPVRAGVPRADLDGARIAGADLYKAKLAGAGMARTNLAGADLLSADLSRANLARATLADAFAVGAKLAGANLYEAKLAGAELPAADLTRATLTAADLTRAESLTQEQVDAARGSGLTRLPEGVVRPASWGPEPPPDAS